jgi:23S rRNA (cytosine1962-C5)-methyltransferase
MTRDITEEINEEFFRKRLRAAWDYRKTVIDTSSCRFLFGEADFVPGMIIDKYEDYYVIQSLALGIDKYKDIVVKLLTEEYNAKGVYERSDARVRELEGMQQTKGFLTEPFDTNLEIIENGVKYHVDIENGQKTGFFLDQKENRAAIQRLCKDADVLDCFTHTGSFALNAGIAGAKSVLGVDISDYAVECCRKNAELNGLSDTVKFESHNAFDILREWSREGRQYDVVILDPPAFTKSRSTIDGATRGYKEINLRGIKLVKPGGYFVTCSCSHFMYPDLFRDTIAEAALDAKRTLRQVEFRTQAADHPILWNSDESYYLKFYVFQVV